MNGHKILFYIMKTIGGMLMFLGFLTIMYSFDPKFDDRQTSTLIFGLVTFIAGSLTYNSIELKKKENEQDKKKLQSM